MPMGPRAEAGGIRPELQDVLLGSDLGSPARSASGAPAQTTPEPGEVLPQLAPCRRPDEPPQAAPEARHGGARGAETTSELLELGLWRVVRRAESGPCFMATRETFLADPEGRNACLQTCSGRAGSPRWMGRMVRPEFESQRVPDSTLLSLVTARLWHGTPCWFWQSQTSQSKASAGPAPPEGAPSRAGAPSLWLSDSWPPVVLAWGDGGFALRSVFSDTPPSVISPLSVPPEHTPTWRLQDKLLVGAPP